MKIMIAFLGQKKNKRNEYLEKIKNIHKNKVLSYNKKEKPNKNYNKNIGKLKFELDKKYNFNILDEKLNNKFFLDYIGISLVICIVATFVIFEFSNIKMFLATHSTNFRQADNIELDSSNIVSTISLFNKKNYVMNKTMAEDNSIKQKEQMEITQTNDIKEYKVIDDAIKNYNVEEVFANNEIKVNILSENATVQKVYVNDTFITNYSSNRNIDFKAILEKDVTLTKKSDKILLYNTHTSESYTNSENYKFEYSSTMRSLDARYNMLAIAKELNENLLKKGFLSSQDTTPHDYGAYTGAYSKSRQTVEKALNSLGGAGIVIDVHRDAIEDLTYRPVANVGGVQVSQIMFVVGIGDNKYWEDNLRLALKLQEVANKIYPGLCRQMIIRDSTYNQDLNRYSMLIEFGATGNTIDEVKLSTRCLANLLNIIYKD